MVAFIEESIECLEHAGLGFFRGSLGLANLLLMSPTGALRRRQIPVVWQCVRARAVERREGDGGRGDALDLSIAATAASPRRACALAPISWSLCH